MRTLPARFASAASAALLAVTLMVAPGVAHADTPCPDATVTVSTAPELVSALSAAAPGDVITLADGGYEGNFVATTPGTAAAPIWLCGGAGAVLSNGGIHGSYGLHLDGASYWHLLGFAVTSAQKGIVVDSATHVTVEGLTVYDVGDEGIHLRSFTTDSLITGNTIHGTGLRRQKFGEGVYVGSANGNWSVYTGGQPDRSDRNTVSYNTIYGTPAENVDIKEGTSDGTVVGNSFDGSAFTGPDGEGADSWVDVKGNNWVVSGNTGHHSTMDGFQTHHNKLIKLGLGDWGLGNTFAGNVADVQGPGRGFYIHDASTTGNVVRCDNTVTAAALGYANVPCTP